MSDVDDLSQACDVVGVDVSAESRCGCKEFALKGRRHVRACLSATLFSKCQACVLLSAEFKDRNVVVAVDVEAHQSKKSSVWLFQKSLRR